MLDQSEALEPIGLLGTVRRRERADQLHRQFGSRLTLLDDNKELATHADTILLSVKPREIRGICEIIAHSVQKETPIISVAAAVPLNKLHEWLPRSKNIIRCMPNVPCGIGHGIVSYYTNMEPKQAMCLMSDIFAPNTVCLCRTMLK